MNAAVAAPRSGNSALGPWRTLITYVGVVAVDTWLLFVIQDVQMGRGIVQDAALGTSRFVASALVFVPLGALLLLPGAVLARELASRQPPATTAGRALAGAVAWAGWGAVIAMVASSASGLVYFAGSAFGAMAILAASGAIFAALGLRAGTPPAGRLAISAAVGIAAVVVIASLFMAGRWGGPA